MSTSKEVRARNLFILNELKRGKTPRTVIDEVIENFDIAPSTAFRFVYEVNAQLNKSVKEVTDKAAEYVQNTLIGEIERGDPRTKMKAVELLMKTCGIGDDKDKKVDVNVNFGFNYGDEDK